MATLNANAEETVVTNATAFGLDVKVRHLYTVLLYVRVY
jgi:hypothetical protein